MDKNYTEYVNELKKQGYECTHYSDTPDGNGLAYYETSSKALKIKYQWTKVGDNHYTPGNIISIEDVTESYK